MRRSPGILPRAFRGYTEISVIGDPYCGNCNYSLKGLTDSSKCPECGKPLVEVLQRGPILFKAGRRYQSETRIFGLPLLSIAFGPNETERMGHARGIIAIGDKATGWLALGGFARGLIAFGGFAMGLFSFGGFSLGLIAALGGTTIGGIACGGGAVGGVAAGGGAVGYIASGGVAVGQYARGGGCFGPHVVSATVRDPAAVAIFQDWSWLLGGMGPFSMLTLPLWVFVFAMGFALLLIAIGFAAYLRRKSAPSPM